MKRILERRRQLIVLFVIGLLPVSAGAASLYVGNNGTESMYVVDTQTRTGTLIGNSGIDLVWGGIGFTADGTLYGYSAAEPSHVPGSLYTVEASTGAWSVIGSSGTFWGEGFDIDPTTNKAYVTGSEALTLYEVDLSTGAAIPSMALPIIVAALAFASDGTLYGTFVNGNSGTLWSMDVSSGTSAFVGLLNIPASITNLAFNPEDGWLYALELSGLELWRFNPNDVDASLNVAAENLGPVTGIPCCGQYTMSTIQISQIPIPAAVWLFGSALALLGWLQRIPH